MFIPFVIVIDITEDYLWPGSINILLFNIDSIYYFIIVSLQINTIHLNTK